MNELQEKIEEILFSNDCPRINIVRDGIFELFKKHITSKHEEMRSEILEYGKFCRDPYQNIGNKDQPTANKVAISVINFLLEEPINESLS